MQRVGDRPFPARDIYLQMVAESTSYSELTAYKAMQRMKQLDPRRPGVRLVRSDKTGFHLELPASTENRFYM
jgi:hypothetical protein